jgi:hypothetical protein
MLFPAVRDATLQYVRLRATPYEMLIAGRLSTQGERDVIDHGGKVRSNHPCGREAEMERLLLNLV